MGLKSHTFVLTAGHVERGEVLDRDDASISRVDRVESGPPDQSKGTWHFKSVITAEMLRHRLHLSRPIAIQGATSKAFYNDDPRGESGAFIQDRTTID